MTQKQLHLSRKEARAFLWNTLVETKKSMWNSLTSIPKRIGSVFTSIFNVFSLRVNIMIGYAIVAALTLSWWSEISIAWGHFTNFAKPLWDIVMAVFDWKWGVIVTAIGGLSIAFFKLFLAVFLAVFKTGIVKAIAIPQLVAGGAYLHKKSDRVQRVFSAVYGGIKRPVMGVVGWWKRQTVLDRFLMGGFIIPLLIMVLIVILIKRVVGMFILNKGVEQAVTRGTKKLIGKFPKLGWKPRVDHDQLETQAMIATASRPIEELREKYKGV